jgi:leader peptidase (prepilin peptidase)/N-methyltransferase
MSAWLILPFSLCVGSFLGVVIGRYGTGRTISWGRSACDTCAAPLTPADLIPVASFWLLRGKCRHCGAPIGWFHQAVEVSALAIAAAALAADGPTTAAWIDSALGWALLTAAWIDFDTFILPDEITLPLILAGLAVTWWQNPPALFNHAAAAALGYLGFILLNATYRALRHRDGLGQGDAKLLAAAGAWLGAAQLPNEILAAGLIGIAIAIVTKAQPTARMPFGPALALAFFGLRLSGAG